MSVCVSVRPSQIRILNDWKLFKIAHAEPKWFNMEVGESEV